MDAIDAKILDLLQTDARRPIREIAQRVGLSSAPVKRRIDRLEKLGVIRGYTAIIDRTRTGAALEAFTEIRFVGATGTADVLADLQTIPEVVQVFTIAGDPDALVRIRVENVQHLQVVVNRMRQSGMVAGTKTLIVMEELNP